VLGVGFIYNEAWKDLAHNTRSSQWQSRNAFGITKSVRLASYGAVAVTDVVTHTSVSHQTFSYDAVLTNFGTETQEYTITAAITAWQPPPAASTSKVTSDFTPPRTMGGSHVVNFPSVPAQTVGDERISHFDSVLQLLCFVMRKHGPLLSDKLKMSDWLSGEGGGRRQHHSQVQTQTCHVPIQNHRVCYRISQDKHQKYCRFRKINLSHVTA